MAMSERERALEVIRLLQNEYPDAKTTLKQNNPLEMLLATILSAQCTDERVNKVTEKLFKKYRTTKDYANADIPELEQDIKSTGFYHAKARSIKKCCSTLVEKFNSKVPDNMNDLLLLPGVGRKTANVVLSSAFGVAEGIAVDTHVRRLSQRLGLTSNSDPDKIEQDLMRIVPKEEWPPVSYLLIDHGRKICVAKHPLCAQCVINKICPSAFTFD